MPDVHVSTPTDPTAWALDPSVVFLNHGSFGACPEAVLAEQDRWRRRIERQPVAFFEREGEAALADARREVARFLNASPEGFAFVPNATTGVNTVLRQVELAAGDEVLMTDHAYPAIGHTVATVCDARGARARIHPIPLPLEPAEVIVEGLLAAIGPATKLVVIDHVTSQTGAILPVERIVAGCRARGVLTLVDAAHAPAMLPVDVETLGADFWTGNFHKWLCAPKGSGGLVVAAEHRARIRPLVTSQPWLTGFNEAFAWTGTHDPTPYLAVPAAIGLLAGFGWDDLRRRNRDLVLRGRAVVADALGAAPVVPEEATGWMAVVPLPEGVATTREQARALTATLVERYRIEVPAVAWNGRGLLRLSAHLYNRAENYEALARAVKDLLG